MSEQSPHVWAAPSPRLPPPLPRRALLGFRWLPHRQGLSSWALTGTEQELLPQHPRCPKGRGAPSPPRGQEQPGHMPFSPSHHGPRHPQPGPGTQG